MPGKKTSSRRISDQSVREKTGKSWQEWLTILDKWDRKEKGHTLTAKHLHENYGLNPWWAQTVTIRYEREKGLRQ